MLVIINSGAVLQNAVRAVIPKVSLGGVVTSEVTVVELIPGNTVPPSTDAPIFEVSDYGIIGNVKQVIPALTEAVKKLKA